MSNVDNLELAASGDHVARGRLDEAKETAELKGELSREDVHDICKACKTYTSDGLQL